MARNLVIATLALWILLFTFAVSVARMPGLALLPLYGLYPSEASSGQPGYHPALMHLWAVGAGVVFLALAFITVRRKSKIAGIGLMLLFLVSIAVACVRFLVALHDADIH